MILYKYKMLKTGSSIYYYTWTIFKNYINVIHSQIGQFSNHYSPRPSYLISLLPCMDLLSLEYKVEQLKNYL